MPTSRSFVFLSLAIVSFAGVARATTANTTTCANSSGPCIAYQNTSSGSAVNFQGSSGFGSRGSSQTGTGLEGKTASGTFMHPGVEGESSKNGSSDAAGAFGLSALTGAAPQYGVLAYGNDAVLGQTTATGTQSAFSGGIVGVDPATPEPSQYGDNRTIDNAGLIGTSTIGYGVLAETNGTPTVAQNGFSIGTYTVAKEQIDRPAIALVAESDYTPIFAYNSKANDEINIGRPDDLFDATHYNTSGTPIGSLTLDNAGDVTITGTLKTSKGTYVRTRGASGALATAYGARTTAPRIEDDGEARLVNGRSDVALDAAFADVIDRRASYLVFVTPEGDSKGLYVATKTATGFTVREQQGGRSTLAFQYRIVAKPVDEDGRRLARLAPEPLPRSIAQDRAKTFYPESARVVTPLQRLARNLGPQEYARELKEFARQQREK